jgi:CRISPR/Cas system CSM-associated protein Csm4 (group 5 of RAMP superfamily)
VEQVKSAFENQITQQKIHNILEHFDLEDSDNHYLNTLKTLNTEQLAIVSKLSKIEFKELLDKPQNQVLQILIQTQITNLKNKGLEVLTDAEFDQYEELQKHLIAVENQKQKKQKETIDDKLKIQNEKLDRLEGILLSNPKTQDNPKIKILEKMFVVIDKNRNQKEMQKYLDEVISFLQEP